MANAKPATKQPAKRARKSQPATRKGRASTKAKATTSEGGITLKDVAAKLGKDPKAVRAKLRKLHGGPVAGKGKRYAWKSFNDKELKELEASYKG